MQGLGFMVHSLGFSEFGVQAVAFKVQGSGVSVCRV